jgi:hypothetical protein
VLKNHREEDSWDSDPVHPKPKIYEEMAKLSVTLCEQAGEVNSKKRPRIDSDGSGGPTARAGAAPDLHGRSDGPGERRQAIGPPTAVAEAAATAEEA